MNERLALSPADRWKESRCSNCPAGFRILIFRSFGEAWLCVYRLFGHSASLVQQPVFSSLKSERWVVVCGVHCGQAVKEHSEVWLLATIPAWLPAVFRESGCSSWEMAAKPKQRKVNISM